MLDVKWLEGLVMIVQMGSFTHAADRLHVSVSGLSRRIQGLESWAGTELIDRTGKTPTLTPAGSLMMPVAMDVIRNLRSVRRSIDEFQSGVRKQIRITAPHTMSSVLFSWWLADVHDRLNSPNISIDSATLPECFNILAENETDFVACMSDPEGNILDKACPDSFWRELPSLVIGTETLIPVSAPSENAQVPVLLKHQPTCSLGWAAENHLNDNQLDICRDNHTQSHLAGGLKSMALAGIGMAWLPTRMIQAELMNGSLVRAFPEEHDIQMDIRLFRLPKNYPPVLEELWKMQEASAIKPN